MARLRPTAGLMVVILAAACSREAAEEGTGRATEPVIRDSAGVRIVENREASAGAWSAAAQPIFTLGWGPDEPTFTWIQSGRILPDGGALVGDFGTGMIYRVGPDGSVMGTWGRKGQGPGEFQGLDAILSWGDSILVSDGRLRRMTLLSFGGEVLTTRPLAGTSVHQVSSILTDGRLLLVPGEGYGQIAATRAEWVFETQPILAANLDTGKADTLAELPHLRRWYGSRGASPGPVSVKGRAGGFAEGFAWARADEPEVRWYDGAGRLVQIARWADEPAPLTREWRRRMAGIVEEAYRSRGAEEAFVTRQLAELEEGLDRHGGPLPYWDSFHVDRRGNAWASQYTLPMEASARWRVMARDGRFEGWVELPEVNILDITDDRVLAVRLNELDVPALVMIELWKP